jgi:hypothetical protein
MEKGVAAFIFNFYKKLKIKNYEQYLEVLDAIGQTLGGVNCKFWRGGLQKLKLWCLNWKTLSTLGD